VIWKIVGPRATVDRRVGSKLVSFPPDSEIRIGMRDGNPTEIVDAFQDQAA
jgi:hypothetical protein